MRPLENGSGGECNATAFNGGRQYFDELRKLDVIRIPCRTVCCVFVGGRLKRDAALERCDAVLVEEPVGLARD